MPTTRIEQLLAFLAQDESDPFLRHALGLEYLKAGDLTAARAQFETVTSRFPDYIGTYYHLGKLLEQLGEQEQALVIYRQGMKRATTLNDRHALRELREAFAEAGGEEEAGF